MIDQLIEEIQRLQAALCAMQADRDELLRQRDSALGMVEAVHVLGGMMPCEPQVFNGLTRTGFAALCARVRQQFGIAIDTDAGTASRSGFTIAWHYDPEVQSLVLQVQDKPFFLSSAIVNDQMKKLVCG